MLENRMSHTAMSPSKCLLFFPFLLIATAQSAADTFLGRSCNFNSNVSSGSQVAANIRRLLPELVSKTESSGYIATTFGQNKDKVYGLAQCRGDVGREDCTSCIRRAAKQIRQQCPNRADVRIWYDYCFLRYNLEDFFDTVDTSFGIYTSSDKNVTDPRTFNEKLGALISQVESQAVEPGNRGLGKAETKLSPSTTLYALVQCTRDLSPASCTQCLAAAVGNFPSFCENRRGYRFLYSNCYARYDLSPFFFPLDANPARAGSSASSMGGVSP